MLIIKPCRVNACIITSDIKKVVQCRLNIVYQKLVFPICYLVDVPGHGFCITCMPLLNYDIRPITLI